MGTKATTEPGPHLLVAIYSSSFSMRFWFSSISRSFCLILAWGGRGGGHRDSVTTGDTTMGGGAGAGVGWDLTSVSTFFLSSRSSRSWSAFWSRLNFSSSWAKVAARLLASSFSRWYFLT